MHHMHAFSRVCNPLRAHNLMLSPLAVKRRLLALSRLFAVFLSSDHCLVLLQEIEGKGLVVKCAHCYLFLFLMIIATVPTIPHSPVFLSLSSSVFCILRKLNKYIFQTHTHTQCVVASLLAASIRCIEAKQRSIVQNEG